MNSNSLEILTCPSCNSTEFDSKILEGSSTDIQEGIVWCANGDWFPIEDRVLEFLRPELQYRDDRKNFRARHHQELKALGLLESESKAASRDLDGLGLIQAQQHHFDWYAENDKQAYDSYAAMPFWKVVDRRTCAIWNAKIQAEPQAGRPAKLLLDVGCAQGRSALMVAQAGVRVIGFDISKRMVKQAYVNFNEPCKQPGEYDFLVADGSRFPFQSGVFDYALVYGVLHHLPDPSAACKEIVRVLKAGGVYFGSENNRTIFRRIFDLLQRLSPAWHEEAGAQPLMSSNEFVHWFQGTGLAIQTSSTVFVPPHLVNVLGVKAGGFVLGATDAILTALPFLSGQGGLILVEGTKT